MSRLAATVHTMAAKLRDDRGATSEAIILAVGLGLLALAVVAALTAWGEGYLQDLTGL